jgi:hypothetical protein
VLKEVERESVSRETFVDDELIEGCGCGGVLFHVCVLVSKAADVSTQTTNQRSPVHRRHKNADGRRQEDEGTIGRSYRRNVDNALETNMTYAQQTRKSCRIDHR